jgi:NAD(P)-dependent dehydrogenase (short-subunit alcohol dehydrogenase family)
MMRMRRIYFITGSSGIAAATARLAAREGAGVFFAGRDEESCRALAADLPGSHFRVAELTDPAQVRGAVEGCVERFGRVDALFNVAGISGRRFGDGPVHECTVEGWEATLDANVKSMFLVCREVVGRMLTQPPGADGERGAVLNMASVLAFAPEPRRFATHAYAASKGAVIGLSKAMAAYYAPHRIRVNVIAPGLVLTPMSARAQDDPEILEYMKVKQPLRGGLIEAEEVARAALFLLGEGARNITGDVLTVDAGWRVSGS